MTKVPRPTHIVRVSDNRLAVVFATLHRTDRHSGTHATNSHSRQYLVVPSHGTNHGLHRSVTDVRLFGARSTAAEVIADIDMTGKTVLVTGGSSGIGLETARAFVSARSRVVLTARQSDAGAAACREIGTAAGDGVEARVLDLAQPASIDRFVSQWNEPLDVLVANAGVMNTPQQRTPQGWELQFATNHLGHFALAHGLHQALVDAGGARVVVLSSSGHASSPVIFDDLFYRRRPYDAELAYGQSKTANVLFCVEANRRWQVDGVTVNAVMPGGVWTNLQRHWDPDELAAMKHATAKSGQTKSAEQGAATSVYVATSPDLDGVGGKYFEDCGEAQVVEHIKDGLHGVRDYALDPAAASRLWDVSLALVDAARVP